MNKPDPPTSFERESPADGRPAAGADKPAESGNTTGATPAGPVRPGKVFTIRVDRASPPQNSLPAAATVQPPAAPEQSQPSAEQPLLLATEMDRLTEQPTALNPIAEAMRQVASQPQQRMPTAEFEAEQGTIAKASAPAEVQATPTATAPTADTQSRIGVLLVNLGTPDAPEPRAVRRYLKEFLTDRRVIEDDSVIWKLILNNFILRFRPRRSARKYAKIWNRERNESPLALFTRSQAEKLAKTLEPLQDVAVDWAMRYGNPPLASRLEALIERGCERILVMPLYPQYAAASTATACDEVFRTLMRMRKQPAIRILPAYYDDAVYIEALSSSLETELSRLDFKPDVVLASYHGIPKSYAQAGDPYPRHCEKTTELLRQRLHLGEDKLIMAYQSRFGRTEWLQPYTDRTVKKLAKSGVKNLVVITPGFVADCLETLEEIAIETGNLFRRHGGANFAAIPCLNDSEPGMLVIWQLALRELKGWV